jgi:hypothetical protein
LSAGPAGQWPGPRASVVVGEPLMGGARQQKKAGKKSKSKPVQQRAGGPAAARSGPGRDSSGEETRPAQAQAETENKPLSLAENVEVFETALKDKKISPQEFKDVRAELERLHELEQQQIRANLRKQELAQQPMDPDEPEPETEAAPGVAAGDRVRIRGLSGALEHNGKTGVVVSFDDAKGRFCVRLDDPQATKPLGLRLGNLAPVVDLQPDEADPVSEQAKGGAVDFDGSFDDMLQSLKEAEGLGPEEIAQQEAAERAAMDRIAADEDLQSAHEAHARLWAKVDNLVPTRDEWHMKLTALETDSERLVEDSALSKGAGRKPGQTSGHGKAGLTFHAKARALRLCEKRLTKLNLDITEHTRAILALEAQYPIVSKRNVRLPSQPPLG